MTTVNSDSPNIMLNLEFSQPGKERDGFFRCMDKNWNSVRYNARPSAADNRTDEEIAKAAAQLTLTKTPENEVEVESQKNGYSGIFTADCKNLTKSDLDELIEKQQSAKGIIWPCVVSFADWYGKEYVPDRSTAYEIINESLPKLFEKSQLDFSNIMWWGAFHTNTQNNHIHLHFWEKEPLRINSKGEPVYVSKGMLPQKNINAFKFSVGRYIAKDLAPQLYPVRDSIRNAARSIFQDSNKILSAFGDQIAEIKANGHFQFARLDREQKKSVMKATKSLINSDSELAKTYRDYKGALKDVQAAYIKIYTDSNIPVADSAKTYYSRKSTELDERLANEFLKAIKHFKAFTRRTETAGGYRRREGGIVGKDYPNQMHMEKRVKAKVTRNLVAGAEKLLNELFLNQQNIVLSHIETLREFQLKLLSEGKEIIYNEEYVNE